MHSGENELKGGQIGGEKNVAIHYSLWHLQGMEAKIAVGQLMENKLL